MIDHLQLLSESERHGTLTFTFRDHCRIINFPNFNIVKGHTVSQEIERPKERETVNGGAVRTRTTLSTKFTVLYWHGSRSP